MKETKKMKKKLQDKLFKKYPKIFSEIMPEAIRTQTDSLYILGISTNNGWFDLIDGLCLALQRTTDRGGEPQIIAAQVKQKFGLLRFYTKGKNTKTQTIVINFAELISKSICEMCGRMDKVSLSDGLWTRSLCKKCLSECGEEK